MSDIIDIDSNMLKYELSDQVTFSRFALEHYVQVRDVQIEALLK